MHRTKEVGIRKVFGAGVVNIVFLLIKGFIVLIAIVYAIAAPVAGITCTTDCRIMPIA
jgi:hypothetical protein